MSWIVMDCREIVKVVKVGERARVVIHLVMVGMSSVVVVVKQGV